MGHMLAMCLPQKPLLPPSATQNQRHTQHTLDCTNFRKIGTSSSSSRWSAYWRATFRMWIGSSLGFWESKTKAGGRRTRGPQPAPSSAYAPCSDTDLAVFLTVQGSAGLAEEGGFPGHVGKAGDDLVEVPGGAGWRGRAEGCCPVTSKVKTVLWADKKLGSSLLPTQHSMSSSNSVQSSLGS